MVTQFGQQIAAYDAIADWYHETVQSDSLVGNLVLSALFRLLGDVAGQKACDLACGQGRVAFQLATMGANVVGVDISTALLAIANRFNAHPRVQYLADDAHSLNKLGDEEYDAVVCNLALMDISDLGQVFQAVWRILRPKGRFVFSLTHPCFEAPHAHWLTGEDGHVSRVIKTYFEEGLWRSSNPHGVRGQVGAQHRMFSTYINALVDAGLIIAEIVEPQAADEVAELRPGYGVVPAFLLVKCLKQTAVS